MRIILKSLTALLLLAFVYSCSNQQNAKDNSVLENFSADSLKSYLKVLAADSFLGRKPFTEGEKITIDYLQKQFVALGLQPGNGESFLQEVPMVNIEANADKQMKIFSPKGNFELKGPDDYVIWTDKTNPVESWNKDEMVFAGYGVVAPEYGWNDYAGLDVKGKIVIVMVNDPGYWVNDPSLFKGKTMTYYGRWTYKYEEAARQGAKGCLIVHNTDAASYPFTVQQNNFNTSRLQLDDRGKDNKNCDIIGWITEGAANKLFLAAGYDSTLLTKANDKGFKPVPLNIQASVGMTVKTTYNKSYNVIGKITGTTHPDEVVIYTAHWDHLGIGRPDATGDSIYNGAIDNASGTAGLLELARVFKTLKKAPERTIVFLSVTAEEQGLLGSKYYTENPIYSPEKTVANINIDGLNAFGKTKDMVIIGEGQSDLEDYLKEEVEKNGGTVTYESHPEAGMYYRSDHFNFAKVGIPAIFTGSGVDVVGKGKEYGMQLEEDYNTNHYHRPSDNYDSTWTFEGGIQDLKLLFSLGKRLAYSNEWPQWKGGSEFKKLRKENHGK